MSQLLIRRGEQSGLLTRIAATQSARLCARMKILTAFLELEAVIRAVVCHLFSALPFNTSQPTTSKLVPPPPQPIKSWPPSAMAYSVSSSPCWECFRTVARTAWFLCMLSTYTSVKPEFPPQPPDTTRIRAQLERSADCTCASGRCFSAAFWQPVRAASAAAANKMVLTLRWFCDPAATASSLIAAL